MSNLIVFVDAVARRAEVEAMTRRANNRALETVLGSEPHTFTLLLTASGRVKYSDVGNVGREFSFANEQAALAYLGARNAIALNVCPLDGISGRYRIEK